jgi:hypothetical protein
VKSASVKSNFGITFASRVVDGFGGVKLIVDENFAVGKSMGDHVVSNPTGILPHDLSRG